MQSNTGEDCYVHREFSSVKTLLHSQGTSKLCPRRSWTEYKTEMRLSNCPKPRQLRWLGWEYSTSWQRYQRGYLTLVALTNNLSSTSTSPATSVGRTVILQAVAHLTRLTRQAPLRINKANRVFLPLLTRSTVHRPSWLLDDHAHPMSRVPYSEAVADILRWCLTRPGNVWLNWGF